MRRHTTLMMFGALALMSGCSPDTLTEREDAGAGCERDGGCGADATAAPDLGAADAADAAADAGPVEPGQGYIHANRGFIDENIWVDTDKDSHVDREDNCPYETNFDQADGDADGVGDVCDNCPGTPNPDQTDSVESGFGDACSDGPAGAICEDERTVFKLGVPNIYFALDTSGSMRGQPLTQAIDGLSEIAEQLSGEIRTSFGAFPIGNTCGDTLKTFLPMGSHRAPKIQASYQTVYADGLTPTAAVLDQIQRLDLTSDTLDPQDDRRVKVVVLITDGFPTVCGSIADAIEGAARLQSEDVSTYVVGYNLQASSNILNRLAEAGGTDASQGQGGDRYFLAANSEELVDVIRTITAEVVKCTYVADPPPESASKVWLKIDDELVPRGAYSYDEEREQIGLTDAYCQALRDRERLPDALTILKGCADPCPPQAFWGCCRDPGQACEADADCCFNRCGADGVCEAECRLGGVSCTANVECCSGACSSADPEGVRRCVVQ